MPGQTIEIRGPVVHALRRAMEQGDYGGGSSRPMTALFIALVLAAHVLLGLVCPRSPWISTAQGALAFGYGLYLVVSRAPLEKIAYVGAYLAGSEVLWRMSNSKLFWEFGKYSIAALFMLAWFRLPNRKKSDLALIYFVLLLPSLVMTFVGLPFGVARREVSFNLSGPFALMVCACFFVNVGLTTDKLHRLFLAFMAPATSIMTVAAYGILTASNLTFGRNSNFATSGGYGPNQVASILGMAALLAIYMLIQAKKVRFATVLVVGAAAAALAAQSAMTFSRGGLMGAGLVGALGAVFMARTREQRIRLLGMGVLAYVVWILAVFPLLDDFTGGALGKRFNDGNVSRRDRLVYADLQIFAENPVFGLGPGTAMEERERISGIGIAHTEFTRLLSDHGSLGLAAMGMLFLVVIQKLLTLNSPIGRCMAVSMISWTLLYMMINGMRLAAAPFFFGLGCAQYVSGGRLALLIYDQPPAAPTRPAEPEPDTETGGRDTASSWSGGD